MFRPAYLALTRTATLILAIPESMQSSRVPNAQAHHIVIDRA